MSDAVKRVQEAVEARRDDLIRFLREICAIPSVESQIRAVGMRIEAEMKALGWDEVTWDSMGNVLGRMGDGPRSILYDSHIDTVGIGDPEAWDWDPFEGKIEDGVFFARGACDEKGSTPGMVYGPAIARELGLLDGWTVYYFGNMEEWCDGIAPHALVEHEKVRPDLVVIGEPTRMQVYRGHKGRVEMEVTAKGKSAHAASNEFGDNALYKLLPVIAGVRDMGPSLRTHEFLGQGRITATDLHVKTPSINAVPDEAILTIDRRVTFGDTVDSALAEVRGLLPEGSDVKVELMQYADPSYTGFVFEVEKYFPAWALEADHPFVQAGLQAVQQLWGRTDPASKWNFSTNGIYWMGKAGIPSIGFGPGDEVHAHMTIDQVRLDDVVDATAFYALLPSLVPAT